MDQSGFVKDRRAAGSSIEKSSLFPLNQRAALEHFCFSIVLRLALVYLRVLIPKDRFCVLGAYDQATDN